MTCVVSICHASASLCPIDTPLAATVQLHTAFWLISRATFSPKLHRAAASQAPHLSGLRFQQTAAADVNPRDLPAFGDSHSSQVRFMGIHAYGDELKRNKNRIFDAATAAGASYSERALVIAMAMVRPKTALLYLLALMLCLDMRHKSPVLQLQAS